ncbi:MAG: quinolinate synthase NadA [Elusimicrobia bacterium]|nr:quinolinate synthase NadA [Elusimicrobiota bacterium]
MDAETLWEEAERLKESGLELLGYGESELLRLAEKTSAIQKLKRRLGAAIPAHLYQRTEIIHGIADFSGDSYALSLRCRDLPARKIIFCGVRFMAETAKILNPDKEVLLPEEEAGCSLADGITSHQLQRLKEQYPGVPVVCYINTSAAVKAESDVVCTSSNASKILRRLYQKHPRVLFVPDEWMAKNLARQLGKKLGEELLFWKGECIVHREFSPEHIRYYRRLYPGVRILAHSECSPEVASSVDLLGGTSDMLRDIELTPAPSYLLVTECGLGDLARTRFPQKKFIPMCRLCPYMKSITLDSVLRALQNPHPGSVIRIPETVLHKARQSLDRMFELTETP